MASDIWLRTIQIAREETRCRQIGYSFRLTARVLLYAPSHRQDNTYHGLCYTSRVALAGTRNSSMGPPHEGSIRRPTNTTQSMFGRWKTKWLSLHKFGKYFIIFFKRNIQIKVLSNNVNEQLCHMVKMLPLYLTVYRNFNIARLMRCD